jgi:hypothetical protein
VTDKEKPKPEKPPSPTTTQPQSIKAPKETLLQYQHPDEKRLIENQDPNRKESRK